MAIVCGVNQIDSNITGLSYAEEACFKILDAPTWYPLEPNSYSDFGADVKTVARQPINPSRQLRRGRVSDYDAGVGFNMDFVKGGWTRIMQGFMFADARQRPTTNPLNGNQLTVSSIAADVITLSAAMAAPVNTLLVGFGFGNPAIDGQVLSVASVAGAAITVNEAIPDVPAPPAGSGFRTVGEKRTAPVATVVNGQLVMDYTSAPATMLPGEWVYIQGVKNLGFGRVLSVAGNKVTYDRTTFTPQAETVATSFFYGTIIRSESDPNLIKRRTYQFERTLGKDAAGTQSEYVTGSVPNTLTVNIPSADKINADFVFVAGGKENRTGLDGLKAGTRATAALGETAFNTSSDVVRTRMTLESDTNSDATPLFGYVSTATINVNNNITANKAVGTIGAFDVSAGNFEANGSVTAYFTNTAALGAIMNGSEAGMYTIAAVENQGIVFDLPSLTLGGGKLAVELNKPITVPLTSQGAQSKFGHTMLFQHFAYLPNAAMPS